MATNFEELPKTTWQHITFTLPSIYWEFFWSNRYLMNLLPKIAADIIQEMAEKQGAKVGIYLAIHTFGRDLKRNFHLHLSTTCSGLSLDHTQWVEGLYFYHKTIKKMWRYQVTNLLREEYKAQRIKLPKSLKHITNYTEFNALLDQEYKKEWVVHLNQQSENHKHNIEYIGKYIKRPPLGETKIKSYDGKTVTYEYMDHYTDSKETLTLPVMDFIARLITHIHDRYFRCIRYYGFLSNRTRSQLLPKVKAFLQQKKQAIQKITFRSLCLKTFGVDPTLCPYCQSKMIAHLSRWHLKIDFKAIHRAVALTRV